MKKYVRSGDDPIAALKHAFPPEMLIRARLDAADTGFFRLVENNQAYRRLVAAQIDALALLDICIVTRGLELTRRQLQKTRRGRQGTQSVEGRPDNKVFALFQVACDQLIGDRSDGRRFYIELAALTGLVFDKKIWPESYHRSLMRVYEKHEIRRHKSDDNEKGITMVGWQSKSD